MRKPKINKEFVAKVYKYASLGLYNCTICHLMNISEETFYKYVRKGEDDIKDNVSSLYVDFNEAIKKGTAEFEARTLAEIQRAIHAGDWQAGAWILERKFKKREDNYNRQEKQQVEHSGDMKIKVSVEDDAD
jgi:hypothetical protein